MGPRFVGLLMAFVFSMDQPVNEVQCGNDWDVKEGSGEITGTGATWTLG